MFRFFQPKEGNCIWQLVPDTKAELEQLVAQKTPLITILAVSEPPDKCEDEDKLQYRGDFYIDVDRNPEDGGIDAAIEDTQRLVTALEGYGVTGMELYCSGGKGFHIIVPAKTFSQNRATTHLHLVYKEMAMQLAGETNAAGVDMAVYSGGQGRMLRQPNVLRKSGTYKVPITHAELLDMTNKIYQKLVLAPREVAVVTQDGKAVGLASMFVLARDKVKKMLKYYRSLVGMPLEELKDLSFDTGCIQKLLTTGDEKEGANFNRAAMVMASFIKDKAYGREEYEPILKQMAKNVKSSTYRSVGVKFKHLMGMVHTALTNQRIKFAAQYLFSVIEPCRDCAICKKQVAEEQAAEDRLEIDSSGVRVRDLTYVKGAGEEARAITNFVIEIDKVYMQFDSELHRHIRTMADITLVHAAGRTPVTVEDEAFISKNALSKAIVGISNLVIKGNDQDVVAIKERVFSQVGEADVIYSADKYGIMEVTNESNSAKYLVYVEPHFSLSMTGMLNQYKVQEGQDAYPKLHKSAEMPPPDFIKQVVKYMFAINSLDSTAQLIGWLVACHFKVHFMKRFNGQFPLMHVFGNAGSGKTATVELLSYLHGMDFCGQDDIVNLGGGTTAYAVKHMIASSTTVPRVFDELNPTKVKDVNKILEILKACWTSQSLSQGGLTSRRGGGTTARVQSIQLSGPVCTIGEQRTELPALNERTLQLHLKLADREGSKDFFGANPVTSFTSLSGRKEFMVSIGRVIMSAALRTTATAVEDRLRANLKLLPKGLPDRPTYARAVALTGLDMLTHCLKGADIDVSEYVDHAKAHWIESMTASQEEDIAEIVKTEVDRVIEAMLPMVSYEELPPPSALRYEYEFLIVKGELYIDFTRAMFLYRRSAVSSGVRPVFGNFQHMRRHLEEEPYFVRYEERTNLPGQNCKFAVLDVTKLTEKGIDASYFFGPDEITQEADGIIS